MVSLAYSSPAASSNDPVFVRTHFLGRVASDGSGLEYQHELLKRRSSRHSGWDANWLAPVTNVMDSDSDDTSDTDEDAYATHSHSARQHQLRSRSSTLPVFVTSSAPVEMARARSMTAPATSSASSEGPTLRKNRSTIGSSTKLMPARPLTIDTAQPLRLSSANVSALAGEPSLSITLPSPIGAVGPSPKTCSPPVVRIECSESDGSCHGDAGDQDPEAQLAAGIIRLREQRRSSSSKSQRRVGNKRRALAAQSSRYATQQQSKVYDDIDSDDAQSLLIRKHGGNFVTRLAEMVLDFSSSALEKLVINESNETTDITAMETQRSPLQPRRRSSTTAKHLSAEAGELLRRRRERIGSLLPSDSSESGRAKSTLTRSWSVPKLLASPLFNPAASLRALTSSTNSTPTTPTSAPTHLQPDFGFTSMSDEHSSFKEISSFEDVGAALSRQSLSVYNRTSSVVEVVPEPGHVSPLWRQ